MKPIVVQKLPKSQQDILMKALIAHEARIQEQVILEQSEQYELYDIMVLKGMLHQTEVFVHLPMSVHERFTMINGVDYPEWI